MTSHDNMPKTEAPDTPASVHVDLFRHVSGLRSWMILKIESPDPWVPSVNLTIDSEHLTVEDMSHKGMAEKMILLMRPAIQQMCATLVEDLKGDPIDL